VPTMKWPMNSRLARKLAAFMLAALVPVAAQAGIVLSQAVVDITPKAPLAQDIEVWNDGSDVTYVVAQPFEITSPGLPGEKREPVEDPAVGGLLVTPQKMILQPGERKIVRIAAVTPRGQNDRVWRVTIKPVAGPVSAPESALKLLLGYDVLVISRPQTLQPNVAGERNGSTLTIRNTGNTNAELYEGKLCPPGGSACSALPSRRIYPGQTWVQTLASGGTVSYRVATAGDSKVQQF
jgi:P pilus assembly chaperone PapD